MILTELIFFSIIVFVIGLIFTILMISSFATLSWFEWKRNDRKNKNIIFVEDCFSEKENI